MNDSEQKASAVKNAVSQIEKQFGKGAIMRLGSDAVVNVPAISTGCLSLDIITGIGGFPRGRVVEVYGPEASGKTTIALQVIAEAQKNGGNAAFIDAEHALDPLYASKLGVNIDELYVAQPDYGEQALEIAEILVRSGGVDIIVVDSVAALVPKAELEGDMGDAHMGLQARLMSQALRKLTAIVARSKTTFVFVNQLREKIGMFIGNPEVTTGGRALKFYSSLRVEVRKILTLKSGNEVVGGRTRLKIVKNKVAPPFKMMEVDMLFGKGVSKEGEVIDLGIEHGFITKTGAWYSYGEHKLGQGRESARQLLEENRALFDELKSKIKVKVGLIQPTEKADNTEKADSTEKVDNTEKADSTEKADNKD